jgi:hypothetical protein
MRMALICACFLALPFFLGPSRPLSATAALPEPSALALSILSAGGLFGLCWRRRLARPAS